MAAHKYDGNYHRMVCCFKVRTTNGAIKLEPQSSTKHRQEIFDKHEYVCIPVGTEEKVYFV